MEMVVFAPSSRNDYGVLLGGSLVFLFGIFLLLGVCIHSKARSRPKGVKENKTLDNLIYSLLSERPMSSKQIIASVTPSMPRIIKSEIQNRLHKMLAKKMVKKTEVMKRVYWSLD